MAQDVIKRMLAQYLQLLILRNDNTMTITQRKDFPNDYKGSKEKHGTKNKESKIEETEEQTAGESSALEELNPTEKGIPICNENNRLLYILYEFKPKILESICETQQEGTVFIAVSQQPRRVATRMFYMKNAWNTEAEKRNMIRETLSLSPNEFKSISNTLILYNTGNIFKRLTFYITGEKPNPEAMKGCRWHTVEEIKHASKLYGTDITPDWYKPRGRRCLGQIVAGVPSSQVDKTVEQQTKPKGAKE